MKRSLEDSDLTEGHGGTKPRKSLQFDSEEGCAAGTVDSASRFGGQKEVETAKEIMRRKLLEKQEKQKKNKAETSEELDQLQSWHKELSAAGFSCEILILTSKHCPLEESNQATQFPDRVLVLYPSDKQTYNHQTGPFHPVRLVVQGNGTWTLQCPIYEHMVINKGKLHTRGETSLLELTRDLLCDDRTLCPGMLEDFNELGYKPENIRIMAGPVRSVHAGSCKIWHLPSSRQELASSSTSRSNASDPRWKRVCTECLEVSRYVRKQLRAKKNVDEATKARRQEPSSHFPLKYLSPNSKTKRARNTRQQRSRLKKQVLRFYKRTKIELPGQQSKELCKLIEAIESSEIGQKELNKITADGNKIEGKGGLKAGNCISQVWQKDRESFFKDQQNNGRYY